MPDKQSSGLGTREKMCSKPKDRFYRQGIQSTGDLFLRDEVYLLRDKTQDSGFHNVLDVGGFRWRLAPNRTAKDHVVV